MKNKAHIQQLSKKTNDETALYVFTWDFNEKSEVQLLYVTFYIFLTNTNPIITKYTNVIVTVAEIGKKEELLHIYWNKPISLKS